jgi:hypothetical protein
MSSNLSPTKKVKHGVPAQCRLYSETFSQIFYIAALDFYYVNVKSHGKPLDMATTNILLLDFFFCSSANLNSTGAPLDQVLLLGKARVVQQLENWSFREIGRRGTMYCKAIFTVYQVLSGWGGVRWSEACLGSLRP